MGMSWEMKNNFIKDTYLFCDELVQVLQVDVKRLVSAYN
jgi:hypothetical protein